MLKLIVQDPSPNDPVEFFRVEKAISGGVVQIVLLSSSQGDIYVPPVYESEAYFRDLVMEDQEIIRQVVRLSGPQTKLTMEYELSVMEFTL